MQESSKVAQGIPKHKKNSYEKWDIGRGDNNAFKKLFENLKIFLCFFFVHSIMLSLLCLFVQILIKSLLCVGILFYITSFKFSLFVILLIETWEGGITLKKFLNI